MKKIWLIGLTLTLCLTGCNIESRTNVENTRKETTNENNIKTEITESIENETTIKEDQLVTDLYNVGNFKLPKINIESEDAKGVNEHFEMIMNKISKQDNSDEHDWYNSTYYKFSNSNEILSIVVKYDRGLIAEFTEYEVFNFDLKTYKLLSTSELNEKFGLTEEFNAMLKLAYDKNITVEEKTVFDANVGYDGIDKTYDEKIIEFMKTKTDEWQTYIDSDGSYHIFIKKLSISGQVGSEYFEDVVLYQ